MKNAPMRISRQRQKVSFRIAAVYAVAGGLWIFLSDKVAAMLCHSPEALTRISMIKGCLYVLVTASLLYYLIDRGLKEVERSQEALHLSEKRFRDMFELASVGMAQADPSTGQWQRVNERLSAITGYTADELVGMSFADLIHPEDRQGNGEAFQKIIQGRTECRLEKRCLRKDGTTIWVNLNQALLYDDAGRPLFSLAVIEDITERKKFEEERLKIAKLESLGLLAGGIAHDFNNILTAIVGNISLARLDQKIGDQGRERLAQAEEACLQAQTLARQLLTFARGGAPIKEPVSLEKLVAESVSLACRGTQVSCEFTFPEEFRAVEGDPGQIRQVFQNLIINAIQAMPVGGTVKIWGENLVIGESGDLPLRAGEYVKISIQDQGIGIPAEYLQKIFDPYFTTKQKGDGLGLAASHSIISNHDGHISVESVLGQGTTFHVYLPASEQEVVLQPQKEMELISGKGKILVMDDEEMVRQVLGRMLLTLGYEAIIAREGAEAIEIFTEAQKTGDSFVGVILDLTVPGGLGGKEVMARLVQIDPQVKAIVSSGYSDDPIMADFVKYGFAGVIAKPYRISELSRVLHRALT